MNNTDRDDDQTNDETAHETNTLRRRRRKSRKKRRKKQNSSSVHPDDLPTPPLNNTNVANRTDEIDLLTLNAHATNHLSLSNSITAVTAIPIDEHDETVQSNEAIRPRRTMRNCLTHLNERIHRSRAYRFASIILRQTRKCLRRYRCWKRSPDRDTSSKDSTDQISLAKKVYEFYNAPVTKFFQDLIFFVLFLAIFTYVVLIRTPPKPSVCEWLLMSYLATVAMDLIRELLMMNGTRWKTWLSVYFHDVLHLYDTFCCLIFAVAFALRLTNDFRTVGRLLLCVNLSLWYLRMFHFLVVSKEVGPYIHIAARNVSFRRNQRELFRRYSYLDYRSISFNCDRFNRFNELWRIETSNQISRC